MRLLKVSKRLIKKETIMCVPYRTKKEWKPIKDFPRYEVSIYGHIRNIVTGKAIKPHINRLGYAQVSLYKTRKFPHTKTVHRLVMSTFKGYRHTEINHKDGNKANSKLKNLEYTTKQQNMDHAKKLGLIAKGSTIFTCKLTEKKVREIRKLSKLKVRQIDIAKRFGIDRSHVSKIKDKKYWRYV